MEASEVTTERSRAGGFGLVGWGGLVLGPLIAVGVYLACPSAVYESGELVSGLTPAGRGVAAVASLMAVWWLTEALPLAATSLLPIALLPLVTTGESAIGIREAASPYASHLIFLFMGGFMIGLAMERSGLHKRVALSTILVVGTKPAQLVGGFMLAAAVLSMWVSNTATAVMMLPIGTSVIQLVDARLADLGLATSRSDPGEHPEGRNFSVCLLLGIAYGCSIGGVGTLIGTPPNLVLANYLKQAYGFEIGMLDWMKVGMPLVAVFLPLTWLLLTRVFYPIKIADLPGGREVISAELRRLGKMSRHEWIVAVVFLLTAGAWVLRPQITAWTGMTGLSDPGIAMVGALVLFAIPVDARERQFALDWPTAEKLPWGVLLLFGGGLSLAAAMDATGVAGWIAGAFDAAQGLPTWAVVLIVVALVKALSELTSNTAVTNTVLPILAGAAAGLGVHPMLLLVPAAISASYVFVLPVATPPNAIVFGSGGITIGEMAKLGVWLNLLSIVVVTVMAVVGLGRLLGFDPTEVLVGFVGARGGGG